MRLLIAFCMLQLAGLTGIGQNLLPNSSFEEENICTEYDKNCAPEAWIASSLWANYYFQEPTRAYDGTHFIGLSAGSLRRPEIRNLLRTRLLCAMQKGKQYRVELYVNSPHDILDSIGIYFSSNDVLFEKKKVKQLTPQLWSANGLDSTRPHHRQWQKLSFVYTASGNEAYIAIGCFKRVDYTGIRRADYRDEYYFYLDKVSLTPVDEKEKLCPQADSVRYAIYGENPRHDLLQRWIYYHTKNPPRELPLPRTVQQVAQRIDTLVIPDIFFATASYTLTATSHHVLDSFAAALQAASIDSVVIEGHTDSVGSLSSNEKLSVNRAGAVKDYLAAKVAGLGHRTVTRGYAYLRPAASNKTPQGRQKNRRVEVFVYRRE